MLRLPEGGNLQSNAPCGVRLRKKHLSVEPTQIDALSLPRRLQSFSHLKPQESSNSIDSLSLTGSKVFAKIFEQYPHIKSLFPFRVSTPRLGIDLRNADAPSQSAVADALGRLGCGGSCHARTV